MIASSHLTEATKLPNHELKQKCIKKYFFLYLHKWLKMEWMNTVDLLILSQQSRERESVVHFSWRLQSSSSSCVVQFGFPLQKRCSDALGEEDPANDASGGGDGEAVTSPAPPNTTNLTSNENQDVEEGMASSSALLKQEGGQKQACAPKSKAGKF